VKSASLGRARVYCYQERQVKRCGQRSSFLDGIEEQLAEYLGTFRLPQESIDHIVSLHEQARDTRNDTEIRRREIEGRLKRITELYKWGDLTKEAYLAHRDRLAGELASLQTVNNYASHVARAAAFLSDLPAAWADATPEQRNALARLIFQKIEIEDDRVTAVVPKPDFAPFFAQAENEMGWPDLATPDCQELSLAGGSDGHRFRVFSLRRRPLPYCVPRHANGISARCPVGITA
jgi:hypothetical protein